MMADMMTFPDTVEEFMEQYKIVDTEGIYMSKGSELVPIFRMKQWFEYKPERKPGKWIPDDSNNYEERFICSVCGKSYKVDTCMGEPMWDFCPCGSDMRGRQDGN